MGKPPGAEDMGTLSWLPLSWIVLHVTQKIWGTFSARQAMSTLSLALPLPLYFSLF